jgi:hypothetical protein
VVDTWRLRIPVHDPGNSQDVRKVFRKRVRRQASGVDIAADVNAVVSVNVGPAKHATVVSSHVEGRSAGEKPSQAHEPPDRRGGEDRA